MRVVRDLQENGLRARLSHTGEALAPVYPPGITGTELHIIRTVFIDEEITDTLTDHQFPETGTAVHQKLDYLPGTLKIALGGRLRNSFTPPR